MSVERKGKEVTCMLNVLVHFVLTQAHTAVTHTQLFLLHWASQFAAELKISYL